MSAICLFGSTLELSNQKNVHYRAFDNTQSHQREEELCSEMSVRSQKQEEVEVDKQKT